MNIQGALHEVERGYKTFKVFEEAKLVLTELASLEQNTQELTHRKASLEAALLRLEEAVAKQEDVISSATAAAVVAQGTKKLAEEAQEKQAKAFAEKEQQQNVLLSRNDNLLAEQQARLSILIDRERQLTSMCNVKEKELASLELKLKTARERVQDMLRV